MDECTEWEINDVVENIPYLDRNLWEGQRLNAYVTAQVNSRKKLTQLDICKFKWEDDALKEDEDPVSQDISLEDIDRLINLSKQWEED